MESRARYGEPGRLRLSRFVSCTTERARAVVERATLASVSTVYLAKTNKSTRQSRQRRRELCHLTMIQPKQPIIPFDRFSSFTRLKRVTGWILRFIENARPSTRKLRGANIHPHLTVSELVASENSWMSIVQHEHFLDEIELLKSDKVVHRGSSLLPFRPFLDKCNLLRVGGRMSNSKFSYSKLHPVILHGNHPVTKLIIRSEHLRLLHAGPTLLISSLSQRFHIIGLRRSVRSITRQCVTCKR